MTWTWATATVINVAGALAVVAFGLFVAIVRPRTAQSSTVAGFAVTFGAATASFNLAAAAGFGEPPGDFFLWVAVFALVGMLASLVRSWWVLPTNLARSERRLLVAPALFVLSWFVFILPTLALRITAYGGGRLAPALFAYASLMTLAMTAWWGLLALLAVRVARATDASEVRAGTPLLAAGLVLYPATTVRFAFGSDPVLAYASTFTVAFVIMTAGLWIWAWTRAGNARIGRNLAWLTLGTALLGLVEGLQGMTLTTGATLGAGFQGGARIFTVALLSYAVVRHHVLGIDVKVRWGVSRGTVAAAFVAVFFIAGEGAQIVFGGGNEWVGLFAAGALVFAIAPLQRVAERFAAQMVPPNLAPGVGSIGVSQTKDEAYRVAVRLALRDGMLGRQEERQLLRLADVLGISPGRAGEIHDDVEKGGGASQ